MNNKALIAKPSFKEFCESMHKIYRTHTDLNLSKDTLIEEIYKEFFAEVSCSHDWKVAGVTSGTNKINDESNVNNYNKTSYKKEEMVVVTSLYCTKCAEIKQETKYT